jgi:hypothetical protein
VGRKEEVDPRTLPADLDDRAEEESGAVAWPSRREVERYGRLRKAAVDFNHKVLDTVPRKGVDRVGKALGIMHGGIFVFDSEDEMTVLADCSIYDWCEGGKSAVQRYAEEHAPEEGTEEHEILDSMLRARFTMFAVEECRRGVGARVLDFLEDDEFFLVDMSIGRSPDLERGAVCARILPFGEHWRTSGLALPVDRWFANALLAKAEERAALAGTDLSRAFNEPEFRLAAVRSWMAYRMTIREYGYADAEEVVERTMRRVNSAMATRVPLNSPCPCGSGKLYKRCCGKRERRSA